MRKLQFSEEAYKRIASAFNSYKLAKNSFTYNELLQFSKAINFPMNNNIFSFLRKSKKIQKVSKSQFVFQSDPIHWKFFQTIIEYYTALNKKYYQNLKSKNTISEIDKAILLLKQNGYLIFKQF